MRMRKAAHRDASNKDYVFTTGDGKKKKSTSAKSSVAGSWIKVMIDSGSTISMVSDASILSN